MVVINSIEEVKERLTKAHVQFFVDKAKSAMDAYEQLVEVRETCGDRDLAEKIYGEYIFILYRSIFKRSNLGKRETVIINYRIFLREDSGSSFFSKENIEKHDGLHELVLSLVDQLYVHTDLCSKYKKIEIFNGVPFKGMSKVEHGINFDGISAIVNFLATVYQNMNNIFKDNEAKFYWSEYARGGWTTTCR